MTGATGALTVVKWTTTGVGAGSGRGVLVGLAGLGVGGTARGFRLNIAAGTAVRFEPGQERTVELVELSGAKTVYGFHAQIMGKL